MLRNQYQCAASCSTIARCRKALGYRFKKASRSQEHQKADKLHPFMLKSDMSYANVFAVDESSFVSLDHPQRGWAKANRAVPKPAPKNRKRLSLILAFNKDGKVVSEVRSGSYRGDSYADFIRQLPDGCNVLADNASIHKTKTVKEVAAEKGIQLVYTPPYCPWFNPVEYAFSSVKHEYRKARAMQLKTHATDIHDAVQKCVTPEHCISFFQHAISCCKKEALRA